jgi:hypothetical protein
MENIYIQLIDDGKSTFHHIPLKSTITLGKAETCDIKLKGKDVASVHALLEAYDADSVTIRSLNPKSKVLVNGKPVDKAKLSYSDVIKIGNAEFQIKKVDLHEAYPPSPSPAKDEEGKALEKKLDMLTPGTTLAKKAQPEIFTTPISEEEIEESITLRETSEPKPIPKEVPQALAPEKSAKEIKEVTETTLPGEVKEPTIAREVVKSSRSLRIREFWWDVILSDNLYGLTKPVTIGSSRKNNYIVPQNGLPRKQVLFHFENMEPYIVFNKHIDGYVLNKDRKIKLNDAKGKLDVSAFHRNDQKIKLSFSDSGHAIHQNIKFEFEFVETPAPAERDKPFSKMDRVQKAILLIVFLLAFLLTTSFFIIPMKVVIAKRPPEKPVVAAVNLGPMRVVTPKPIVAKIGGEKKTEGKEGEGARAAGAEGKRGKSTQGPKGPTTMDLIRENKLGLLGFFRTSGALKDIAGGGGGGDLSGVTGKLRAGLPGETTIREGKGLKGSGTGGGGTFVGSGPGGLGQKGTGLGREGTGRADFGKGGEARVTVRAEALTEEGTYQGDMDPSIIERIIKNHLGYIKWCYEKELNTNPEIEGKIVVDFIIGVEGMVTSSKVKNSSMGSDPVESCIARRIKTLRFPNPKSGIVQVFYPFIFRVAGGQ